MRNLKRLFVLFAVVLSSLIAVWVMRAVLSRDLPDLQVWHRPVLESEYRARDYPDGIAFSQYLALEEKLVNEIGSLISEQLESVQQRVTNRYYTESPAHPSHWASNWNMSFELVPEEPVGAVVLLHGASDSPYSMRALAQAFFNSGLHVVVPRLPGNGTIPGALINTRTDDWNAILPMALTRARERIDASGPVYLGGYSTGAALALGYALRAHSDSQLQQVDGLYMFSPAIGVSGFAGFARWDLLISKLPGFEKFAWQTVWPEYDPFKYASFPKQAGHIVHQLTTENIRQIDRLEESGNWEGFPSILTFQSVVDETVSVSAVLNLHESLQSSGNQLVLFDVNRNSTIAPFLRNDGSDLLARVSAKEWSGLDVTVVGNNGEEQRRVVAIRHCEENLVCGTTFNLQSIWPPNVYSLSHVAVPFSPDDPLYGGVEATPAPGAYNLGQVYAKGERRVLVIPAEDVNRLRHNPFFDYMQRRVLDFCRTCTVPRMADADSL